MACARLYSRVQRSSLPITQIRHPFVVCSGYCYSGRRLERRTDELPWRHARRRVGAAASPTTNNAVSSRHLYRPVPRDKPRAWTIQEQGDAVSATSRKLSLVNSTPLLLRHGQPPVGCTDMRNATFGRFGPVAAVLGNVGLHMLFVGCGVLAWPGTHRLTYTTTLGECRQRRQPQRCTASQVQLSACHRKRKREPRMPGDSRHCTWKLGFNRRMPSHFCRH